MSPGLQEELQQSKPFVHTQEELLLNLLRTAYAVGHHLDQCFRPYGLSVTQYNVLRILRGAGRNGLCQYEIADRLIAQVPDVPRILERMDKAGWVTRIRATSDRRMVISSLSAGGVRLAADLDGPITQMMSHLFPAMTEDQMNALCDLLVQARKTD